MAGTKNKVWGKCQRRVSHIIVWLECRIYEGSRQYAGKADCEGLEFSEESISVNFLNLAMRKLKRTWH